ncbi:MAG: C45 family peptidase [Nanoarchaeota archaeon]|nr:C45 family peptidase [Nanoarchaeota archaeon]
MEKISYIEVSGTNYEIGFGIGECLKEKLIPYNQDRQKFYYNYSKNSKFSLDKKTKEIEKIILKYFPQYLEELKGIADGATIPLKDIILLCNEETMMNTVNEKCTTLAYKGKKVFLGHNEDWAPGYEGNLYVVKASPKKGASFISMAYLGALAGSSVAMNEYGITFSGNSLLKGLQRGIPKNIILRSQIEAKTLKEFERLATFQPRAIPNHSMAVDKKGNIISVEVRLKKHSVIYTKGPYVHTNHTIHEKMLDLEELPLGNSTKNRYLTAMSYVQKNKTLDEELMKKILRSHDKKPYTICIHAKTKKYSDSQTIGSAIANVSDLTFSVALGNPCESEYKTFYL